MSRSYSPRLAKPQDIRHEKGEKNSEKSEVSPLLGLMMILSWIATGTFFFMVHPSHLKDVIFPTSYFPAVFVIGLTSYLTFSYFGKSARRGIFAGIAISISFWLILRDIMDPLAFGYVFFPFVILELILTMTSEK